MTLSGSSTHAQIKAAYDDNASYEELNDAAKARAFITAARILLRRMPAMASQDRASLQLSPALIAGELKAAQQWLALNAAPPIAAAGSGVGHFSMENLRGEGGDNAGA